MAARFREARKKAGLAEKPRALLRTPRLRYQGDEEDRESKGRDESDGASGCEDGDEIPTS